MLGIYTVISPIKQGTFGSVFLGKNTITDDHVAIKVDSNTDSLQHETSILQHLSAKECRIVPPIFNYGKLSNGKNYLVMPYYQTSLSDYLAQYPSGVSPEHAKEILREMFDMLKHIHRRWIIHRDIKPANFMIKNDGSLVLIDFGLATYYMTDSKTHISMARHIPEENVDFLIGSRRYASINIHLGYTPSRRDDLISASYIYIAARWPKYMHDGTQTVDWIAKKRLDNLPEESRTLFKYLYSLAFMVSPDYTISI